MNISNKKATLLNWENVKELHKFRVILLKAKRLWYSGKIYLEPMGSVSIRDMCKTDWFGSNCRFTPKRAPPYDTIVNNNVELFLLKGPYEVGKCGDSRDVQGVVGIFL